MKTPAEILDSEFATQNLTGMVRDGVIQAMKHYAAECAAISEYQSVQSKLNDEQYQNTLLAQKCSDLSDELEIYKDIDLQALVKEQQQTIENQEAELKYLTSQLKAVTRETVDHEERFDALDDEYQELVKLSTMIFRGIPRFELTALMSPDDFEKFKNHLGV